MSLNIPALRAFVAVVDSRGFSRAAAALRISQPAISKSVSTLERDVGMPLLERRSDGIRLTGAGQVLYQHATELFAVERAAEEELRAYLGLERGTLRIGASTTIATYLLPTELAQFHAEFPSVTLRVVSTNTRAVARLLLQRKIDVALVEGPVSHPRIEATPWRADALVVIAPPNHALANKRRIAPSDIAGEPFIVRETGSGTRVEGDKALSERGIHPTVALTLGSTEAIKQAVIAGLGLAVLSRSAVAEHVTAGTIGVLDILDWNVQRDFTLLRLRGRAPSAAARKFEELIAG